MVDLHCHILPGIDDGAQSLSDSVAMAKQAVEDGITAIVATPHFHKTVYENTKPTILAKTAELNEALKAEGMDLRILPGQEPRIDGDLLTDLEENKAITLAGSTNLFIEFPSAHVPRYTERLLYDLQQVGYTPIIVHPERNQEIIEHPDMLYNFVNNGALTQVTAASLCGDFGKKIKNFSFQLVEYNLTHFVASDAHNTTTRRFRLHEAFKQVSMKFGNDYEYMLKENAELLIEGKTVYKEIPEKIKKKKLFKLF
jgi:protein-tyrosine phosphatase